MARSHHLAAALAVGTAITASSAFGQVEFFQELLVNGNFETGDYTGWEEDNAYGGRKWEVVTGPLGASGMVPTDESQFATPFNAGPISMPWGTLLQAIDLDSLTFPTIIVGGDASQNRSNVETVVFPSTDQANLPYHIPGYVPPGDGPAPSDGPDPGDGPNNGPVEIELVPTDRLNVSVEAIYGYDTVEFELRYLDEDGQVLRVDDLGKHGYQPEINEGPWNGVNKVVTDEVIIPENTRYISFWARTELVLGTYIDAGFDNASLQLELVPGDPVPEPGGLAVMALGGLLLRRRR
ncbi:MAG: hypothetical protein AAGD32_09135 [Planctomycetota bacterium]